ncbi:MAG TPA: tetratricopeptide repeat protein [Candidatus Acidoferrales bacterium]|nr:tetratricopeptide repeat protein [Candidatus Acidoferrales bacterium]
MRLRHSHISAAACAAIFFAAWVALLSSAPRSLLAQTPAAQNAPTTNSTAEPSEPFVLERYSTKIRFETNGTGERRQEVRVKVTGDAGVKQLHTLTFDYNSEDETFALAYLRIAKPDGTVAETSSQAIAKMIDDQPAPVVKDAPSFKEIREVHVTLPPLAIGDTLSYESDTKIIKPTAPGEFWYAHTFLSHTRARDEELQIDLPASRAVHWKMSAQFSPAATASGARKIYTWKRTQAQAAPPATAAVSSSGDDSADAGAAPGSKPPDVILTSFTTWRAAGKWIATLDDSAAKPNDAVAAKAQALIATQKTDGDKIETLYDFVAKQIRFVDIPFEQVDFQPHDAATVLSDGYGDGLDKCALLAALLNAVGFHGDVALLSSSAKLRPDLPWPGALNHAILAVTAGKEVFWLDPSSDVLPFRMLLPNLRGQQALIASTAVAPHFAATPLDLPFQSSQTVEITGRVSSLGRLVARIRYTLRGDNEVALRMAFERTPQAQWKQVAQTMATLDGLQGEVTDAKPSDPTATRDPFTLDFILVNEEFLDWSQPKTILKLPLPTFGLPDASENSASPIELGNPLDVTAKLTLTLPVNDSPQMPVGAGVTRDYATYHSSYASQEHVVTAERSLRFIAREVPASRRADYLAFAHAVEADESQGVMVADIIPGVPEDATSGALMESGTAELKAGNNAKALQLFNAVAQINPQQVNLWRVLGLAQLGLGKYADATVSFRKQLVANPTDDTANNLLGVALYDQKKYDDAAAAFQKQIVLKPLDPNAYGYLGAVYIDQKRYDAALAQLEKAVVLDPDSAAVRLRLGQAYLATGKTENALGAFDKAAGLSPSALIWNQIAYDLAERDVALDRAEYYANLAVSSTEAALSRVDLRHLTNENFGNTVALPAFWDTLGWVHFQQRRMKEAESLIASAWLLDERGDEGYHLARIYEARGDKELAIRTYTLALTSPGAPADTRTRLAKLLGSAAGIDLRVKDSGAELLHMRTIPLGKTIAASGKAIFLVSLAPGPNGPVVRQARFLGGDDKLSGFGDRLREAKFPAVLPANSKARLVLRGTLECTPKAAACNFVFDRPRDLLVRR